MINSRERVIRAIKFEKVDRIPIIHVFLPRGTVEEVKNYVRLVLEKFDAKRGKL